MSRTAQPDENNSLMRWALSLAIRESVRRHLEVGQFVLLAGDSWTKSPLLWSNTLKDKKCLSFNHTTSGSWTSSAVWSISISD